MADAIVRVVLADMPEVKAEIARLRAALDEANTERRELQQIVQAQNAAEEKHIAYGQYCHGRAVAAESERDRLAKDNERCSEAWRRVVLRQQRTDNAHDYDMRQVEAERDHAVAQVQRAKTRIDTEHTNGAISQAVWQRLILILAGEGPEQLPAKPDVELEVANQNLRTLEKTVTNLKSGLRTEQTARERALALCDEYEGVEGTDYDDLARKIRAALDVHGPAEALRAGYEAMAREAAEDKHGGEE